MGMSSERRKIICVDVCDPRLSESHKARIMEAGRRFVEMIEGAKNEIIRPRHVLTTETEADAFLSTVDLKNCCGLIVRLAWFHRSNVTVGLAQKTALPCLCVAIDDPNDTSLEGLALAHGSLDEVGIQHRTLLCELREDSVKEIRAWMAACVARKIFGNSVYGEIGGRSLEMIPACSDHNQLRKVFGIHVVTFEQRELIERAKGIDKKESDIVVKEWKSRFGSIECSKESLERSARVYLAGKELFTEK